MSTIDPEVLYLILTKVSAKEAFYGFNFAATPSGQKAGTILRRQFAEVYERITGSRIGARLNWDVPLDQLNALLKKCGFPPLGIIVVPDRAASAIDEATLAKIHATKWPIFSELKSTYKK